MKVFFSHFGITREQKKQDLDPLATNLSRQKFGHLKPTSARRSKTYVQAQSRKNQPLAISWTQQHFDPGTRLPRDKRRTVLCSLKSAEACPSLLPFTWDKPYGCPLGKPWK
jgi:hypothetical protein